MDISFEHPFDVTNYGGKLFKVNQTKKVVESSISVAGALTDEGKSLQEMMKKEWLATVTKFVKETEAQYRDIFMDTERRLYASAAKRKDEWAKAGEKAAVEKKVSNWLDEEANGANQMIKQALIAFEQSFKSKLEQTWKKVATAFDKKFKSSISKSKIIAAVKIIGLSIVVVAGAALTIAASVLGAMASPTGVGLVAGIGLALGGIATSASAAKKIYDIYASNWPNHKTAMATLQKKTKALEDALKYENDKLEKASDGRKLGPKERLKLFFGNTAGKRKELAEAIKAVATWTMTMKQDIEKEAQAELLLEKQLDELEAKIKKAPDDKTKAAVQKQFDAGIKTIFDSRGARENARRHLKDIEEALKDGALILGTESKLTTSDLAVFSGKVQKLANSKTLDVLITTGKASKDFIGKLVTFLKTVK